MDAYLGIFRWQSFQIAVLVVMALFLQSCSTLSPRTAVTPSYYIKDSQDTSLGKILAPYIEKNPQLTGYQVLIDPIDAIAARLTLIEKSQKSIDLQYYIWHNDKVGALTMEAILRAADRGVRVRLLLDDNNTGDLDSSLLALQEHPNIEIRLFNPLVYRKWRIMNYVLDLKRVNRRMHNKTFLVDSQVALIGGRNISNQYFDAGETFQFSDIDVMLAGKIVPEIAQSFDDYWNYPMAYPANQIISRQEHRLTLPQLRRQLHDFYTTSSAQNYLDLAKEQADFSTTLNNALKMQWTTAHLVQDAPEKIDHDNKQKQHLTFELNRLVGEPTQQLDVISAYFVPADVGTDALIKLKQKGVRVRVLTNSYAANDVGVVHAFYAKRRQKLLENGVELYEFLPQMPNTTKRLFRRSKKLTDEIIPNSFGGSGSAKQVKVGSNADGSSEASLHAKMMLFDESQIFIGSFNFDPRSAYLNTEIGVILDSPTLSKQVSKDLDNSIMNIAYQVKLDKNGKLIWLEKTPEGIKTHTSEPNIKPVTRFSLKLISMLPLDGFM